MQNWTGECFPFILGLSNLAHIQKASPVDALVVAMGEASPEQRIEQIKGKEYAIKDFLGHLPLAGFYPTLTELQNPKVHNGDLISEDRSVKNKFYHIVLYLSPADYHRIHSPVSWSVMKTTHFSGKLHSVAIPVVQKIDNLFAINERIVVEGSYMHGFFSLTAVGARNVGSINLSFDPSIKTNQFWTNINAIVEKKHGNKLTGLPMRRGEELGHFNFGSTVVLLFEAPSSFKWSVSEGEKVKLGQKLGDFK